MITQLNCALVDIAHPMVSSKLITLSRSSGLVAGFPGIEQPAGLLVHKLTLQQLEDVKGRVGLSQFMLWANNEQTKAPPGFRWLTQYIEKLAERHALPVIPVGLRLSGGQPLLTLGMPPLLPMVIAPLC